MNVLRETVRLLSLGEFTFKRGWGKRKLGYATMHYYRGGTAFVKNDITNAEINETMLELATAYLAKRLACFECLKEKAEYQRSKRRLLRAAEQNAVPKLNLLRAVFQIVDSEEILNQLKKS